MPEIPNKKNKGLHGAAVFLIAVLTGAAGCVLGFLAGDYISRLYHVSDMEGERAYVVVFLCAPLGLVIGFFCGLIVAFRTTTRGAAGFLKAQIVGVLVTVIIAAITTGLFWLGADKPPKLDGKNLALDFELRIPPTVTFPAEPSSSNVHASLYANDRDNRFAEINFTGIHRDGDAVIVPGTAALMSRSSNRSLLAHIEGESGSSQFLPLRLPASPRTENEAWSDWMRATQRADLTPVPEPQRIAVRYRVRPIND
jgi:hypothetical protein